MGEGGYRYVKKLITVVRITTSPGIVGGFEVYGYRLSKSFTFGIWLYVYVGAIRDFATFWHTFWLGKMLKRHFLRTKINYGRTNYNQPRDCGGF